MFSPITHRPMHIINTGNPQAGRSSATARAQSYQPLNQNQTQDYKASDR